jgi:voltage-gated potassium channel Kch
MNHTKRSVLRSPPALFFTPDRLGHAVLWVVGFAILTILFFAVLYTELGVVATFEPSRPVVRSFTAALYFSASTFTTVGFGDFVPTPESRLFATVEALTGYIVLGTITGVIFFLLSRSAPRSASVAPGGRPKDNEPPAR